MQLPGSERLRCERTARAALAIAICLLTAVGCGSITPVEGGRDSGGADGARDGSTLGDAPGSEAPRADGAPADAPLVCPAGFADCDGDPRTGCEADLSKAAHCGACATACAEPAPFCAMAAGGAGAPGCASGCAGATPTRCDMTCVSTDSDVGHCGGCGMACPARANTTASCGAGSCSWTCLPMFVDVDGDRSAPRGDPSTGCECRLSGSVDRPDLAFSDDDCDGIDGAVNSAVFVSPRGLDSAAGTMAAPKRTLAAAIAAAAAANPRRDVYAALGVYNEAVTLASGVSIFGGYDDLRGWARAAAAAGVTTTIKSPTAIGVLGNGVNAPLELQLLTIRAGDATGVGNSSTGVRIVASAAEVTLRGCHVIAGAGSIGADGSSGSPGAPGGSGAVGQTGGGKAPGGPSSCAVGGGLGAASVSGAQDGSPGGGGFGPAPGSGGSGAIGFGTCLNGGSHGNNAPDNATVGQPGAPGANGPISASFGSTTPAGIFQPAFAGDGRPGDPGSGGGGGGSGSGDAKLSGLTCVDAVSGGGGGGGAGGCPGTVGTGGGGGGGSFAVVSVSSAVVIDQCQLDAGRGGDGGLGGNGGLGGIGGFGRSGGPSGGQTAGYGAPGKDGGLGGAAGNGAGGNGGPSICVLYLGSVPAQGQSTCARAGGGAGGLGGTNGALGRAPIGQAGVSVDVRTGT